MVVVLPYIYMVYFLCRVFSFILSEPLKRLSLCIYWVCVIYASVLRFYNISKSSKIERILLRKYYHLMAVSMFVPALIFQVIQICLSFIVIFAVFYSYFLYRVFSHITNWVLIFQPKFLNLAFGVALGVFLVLEIIRVSCHTCSTNIFTILSFVFIWIVSISCVFHEKLFTLLVKLLMLTLSQIHGYFYEKLALVKIINWKIIYSILEFVLAKTQTWE